MKDLKRNRPVLYKSGIRNTGDNSYTEAYVVSEDFEGAYQVLSNSIKEDKSLKIVSLDEVSSNCAISKYYLGDIKIKEKDDKLGVK
jgi:hypothetical protein